MSFTTLQKNCACVLTNRLIPCTWNVQETITDSILTGLLRICNYYSLKGQLLLLLSIYKPLDSLQLLLPAFAPPIFFKYRYLKVELDTIFISIIEWQL